MKTKVIFAALLAMMVIGVNAEANTLSTVKNGKKIMVFHRKASNKKKAAKPTKPGKKAKAAKGSKQAATSSTAKPAGK